MKILKFLFVSIILITSIYANEIDGLRIGMPVEKALSLLNDRGFDNITKLGDLNLWVRSKNNDSISYNLAREGELVNLVSKQIDGDFRRFVNIVDFYTNSYGPSTGVSVIKTAPTDQVDIASLRIFWVTKDMSLEASFDGHSVLITLWPPKSSLRK